MVKNVITSESVTEGHPDKVCDQISDAILDELIKQDPKSHAAIECLITTGTVFVAGEISTSGWIDVNKVARRVLGQIGYTNPEYGIDHLDCGVITAIHEQSQDIAVGVSDNAGLHEEQGAGDQGMMFGFACDETPELMPLPITLAHKLTMKLTELRKNKTLEWARPDGKSQVTVEYEDGTPKRVDAVVIAIQHDHVEREKVYNEILEQVIKPVVGDWMDDDTKIFVNETGIFEKGGPEADTGVTGRKIIVDTYGGYSRHGGGAFSGKDPSKVDRSATYAARYIAKNIVAAGLAKKCEVQLAYTIGVAEPVSILIETFGTGTVDEEKISEAVRRIFPIKPVDIIEKLELLRPIYQKTASYGHFGREEPEFTWEKTDKVEELKKELNA